METCPLVGGGCFGACCVQENDACPCQITDAVTCADLGGYRLDPDSTCDPGPYGDPCDCNANGECDANDVVPGGGTEKVYISLPNLFIPASNPVGVTDTIVVPHHGIISDLDVGLDIDHTWVGSLCVTLTGPYGMSVSIIDRPGLPDPGPCDATGCCGCSEDNYDIMLDDEGTGGPIEDRCWPDLTSPPNYTPNNPLSAWDGRDKQGVWTITVIANTGGDIGFLNMWSLHFLNEVGEPNSMDYNNNGVPDECEAAIPAVSEWGLIVFALLLLTGGAIILGRRRPVKG